VSSPAGDVAIDPIGVVVALITGLEPGPEQTSITEVVAGVAGGRAKRRRLAQALLARPEILTDGRSPAPEAIGKLLTALRDAGAVNVSPPVCAEYGKPLRTFQRRGQDWYCGVHGPETAACTVCGNVRPVALRDRARQPHCWQCPLTEEHDPTQIVIELVRSLDPTLDVEMVRAVIGGAAYTARQLPATRRTGTGVVSPVFDHRPGEPGDLPALPTTSSGQRPNTGRPAASLVSAHRDGDLFDLRALGSRLDLPAHRTSVLPHVPAAASTLQRLRQRQTGSQRNPHPTTLRFLHSPWRPLARLSRLRRAHPAPLAPMRPLHAPTTTG